MDQIDTVQEQMGCISRDMEILRRNQKAVLGIRHTVTEIKNALDGSMSRQERISELADMPIVTSKTEKRSEKIIEKKTEQNIQTLWGSYQSPIICVTGVPEEEMP